MPVHELTDRFYKAIYPLIGWKYDPATFNQNSLEARGVVDKFIFQPLNDDQRTDVMRGIKTDRLPIPPPLDSIIHYPSVADQANLVIDLIAEGKSFEDLYEAFTPAGGMTIEQFSEVISKFLVTKD